MSMKQIEAEANATQVGGEHYKHRAIQPWDYIVSNDIPFLEGCAIKHLTRHREKNKREDLEKAIHYIRKAIEVYYPDRTENSPKVPTAFKHLLERNHE
jgi:hypothetical protein